MLLPGGRWRERTSVLGTGRRREPPRLLVRPCRLPDPTPLPSVFPCQHLTRVSARGCQKCPLPPTFSLPPPHWAAGEGDGCEGLAAQEPPLGDQESRRYERAFLPKPSRRDGLGNQRTDRCGCRHGILHTFFGSRFFSVALVIYSPLI